MILIQSIFFSLILVYPLSRKKGKDNCALEFQVALENGMYYHDLHYCDEDATSRRVASTSNYCKSLQASVGCI